MKRCIWVGLLVIALAMLSVGCASMKEMRAKRGEAKKAKVEKAEKVEAEKKAEAKAEKKAEAKAEKKAEAKAEKAQETEAEAPSGLTRVESSVLRAVGYDATSKDLTIVMKKRGETYVYHNVPPNVYKELMAAESKGKFFTKNIKDKYEYTKK